ncbi:portal protein [Undibacterium umbellatum]|uniref:Portal protein n=1 Tax=Undibacterium umbellatum TaxID=2762300 RepID=A0ABR6Z359_9BURK|nr:portal protein [Undibacterium umbellatum]MBC3906216.1 hypothetical protein [Undibacterium umbellatum]
MSVVTEEKPGVNASKEEKARIKHGRLYNWFETEMRRQQANRFQMALDEDYYDSIQWRPDEIAELKDRGQQPTVYNEIKPTIDWLIGVERRTRVDFEVMARDDDEGADEDAKCKTKLLKYIADVNRVEFERSAAADDCFKAGLGWLEIGISPDPEDEPIYSRFESWRNILYDSLGTRDDLEDSRYLFRFRTLDLDIAIAYFPDKERELRASAVHQDKEQFLEYFNGKRLDSSSDYEGTTDKYNMYDYSAWEHNDRERVTLIEAWYKEPTKETTGKGVSAIDRTRMLMQCTIMTAKYIINDSPSPYKHNRFPFVPYWCYRRKKDNAPYSVIRPVRSPQDALNKRMSKAIHVISTNQVIAEADAFDDNVMTAEEARDELQAPDAFVLLAKGGLEKLKTHRENDVAQGHLQMAQADREIIRNASGVTSENLGRDTNATSGIAIQRKSEQGSQQTAEIFDNMLFSRQMEGEIKLSLIEQYYNEAKTFSITGERKKREYVRINQKDPVTGQLLNDMTARKAMFVIGENAWKQTLQQAAFESLMQLLTQLAPTAPQVVTALLDTVFELADLPNKKLVIQRIRQITGMTDPDEPPTPEQQQAQQQQQALQQAQIEAQMAQAKADIVKANAQGEQIDADRLKKTIEAVYVAMQASQTIAQVPGVTPVADELLKSVGFRDQNPGMPQAPEMVPLPVDQPTQALPPAPLQADGAATGIETMTPTDNIQGAG